MLNSVVLFKGMEFMINYDDQQSSKADPKLNVLWKMFLNSKAVEVILDAEDEGRIMSRKESVNSLMTWYNVSSLLVTAYTILF